MDTTNRIIEQIYDLVSAPADYDDFMLELQRKISELPGPNDPERAALIEGHLSRASDLVDIVTPWRMHDDNTLTEDLAKRHQATFVLDGTGEILEANMAAQTLYGIPPQSVLGDLPLDEEDAATLLSAARDATLRRASGNKPNPLLNLHNTRTERPFVAHVMRFKMQASGKTVAVVRTGDVAWPNYLGAILRDLFGLSAAEVEVLRLLVQGHKVDEISDLRATSVTTIRSQLRAIFAKTNTDTQSDCVRLVFGLAVMHDHNEGEALATQIQAAAEISFFPRDADLHVFQLPNGRIVEYSDFAAPSGPVVLFYHDQAFGDVWFGDAVDQAKRMGLRIIGPRRPGFGKTTVYPGKWSEPRKHAPEALALLDHLQIERVALMTLSSGLVHGLALAEIAPDRITSITAGHPLLPVVTDADLEGTNGYNHLIPYTRLHFPRAVRFLCRAGFAFVSASGPGAFGKAVMRASPWDVEWISRPDVLPVMEEGRRVHENQGYVGNFGDISYARDWSDLLQTCPAPVRLVIGENDRNVQWASARRLAAEHEHIDLKVLKDSGYMVHHQQARQFLTWLSEDLRKPY